MRVRASNAAPTRLGLDLADRPESRADLGGEELWLLPGCKVVALVDLAGGLNPLELGLAQRLADKTPMLTASDGTS